MRTLVIAAFLALAALAAPAAHAASPAKSSPRLSDGHPDLNGVWSNASITKLTRPAGRPLVVPEGQAKAREANFGRNWKAGLDPTDPNAPPPRVGDDPAGSNSFWADPGAFLGRVRGEARGSWIVEPGDGQLPLSEGGRRRVAEAAVFARAAGAPSDPEALEPWDRCLIGSRGSGGPGMLNNLYNSNYQIVQTADSVAIVVEMIHEVRTVPLFRDRAAAQAGHGPPEIQPWLGDSVGWWEGDALVVETTHVNPEQGRAGPIYLTPQGRVTERFTRASVGQIFYAFEVDDPAYYSRPWRAEMSLNAAPGRLFEYACHEGNYALANILRGVRTVEARTEAAGRPVVRR